MLCIITVFQTVIYLLTAILESRSKDDGNGDDDEMDEELEEQPAIEELPLSEKSLQAEKTASSAVQDTPLSATMMAPVATTSYISYGIRQSREAYSPGDLQVAALLNRCIKGAYSQWLRAAEMKVTSSRIKRDSYSTLRLSCLQAAVEQLNYAQYKSSYIALLDLHDIKLADDDGKGIYDPSFASSSSPQRVKFLESFMAAFMDRLSGHNTSAECLHIFTAAIVNLPDSY